MNPPFRIVAVVSALLVATAALTAPAARAQAPGPCEAASRQAQTLMKNRKLVEAREQLLTCQAPTCSPETRTDCSGWFSEVDKATPSVVFDVRDGAGQPLTAVTVTMDGSKLVDSLNGAAVPIDPGPHAFVFSVAGMQDASQTFAAIEGAQLTRVSVTMQPVVPTATPGTVDTASPSPPPSPALISPPASAGGHPSGGSSSPVKTAGFVVGGVGIAGLAVGLVFGGVAISTDGNAHCDSSSPPHCADPQARKNAITAANVSTALVVAGSIALAGGVAIVLFAPKARPSSSARVELSPVIGCRATGLALGGRF